jgi:general secretion pathway protein A
MYQRFYGFNELPFELTPNPKYIFFTKQHREALSNLQYGLFSAKSITLLMGEAGTGKTTLLRAALDSDRCRQVSCVYINNPALKRDEFVELLANRFELGPRAAESKTALLAELERVLVERRLRGEITALVVDEAQCLSTELLEEIRLLANSETATEKLLPVVLAGQPELRDRLNDPGLRQLKQRVALRCEIAPFRVEETAGYLTARIRVAGGDAANVFTRDAVMLIHEQSRGIPRTINVICDNALLTGMAIGRRLIDCEIIREVVRDFDLGHSEPRAQASDASRGPDHVESEPPAAALDPSPDEASADPSPAEPVSVDATRRRFSFLKTR